MSDWIKIHRSVLDSFCFANPNHFRVWVWMLLKANYKAAYVPLKIGKGYTTVKVERGQFIFGRNKAKEELDIDPNMIYRILQKFEELEQIKIEPNNQYSIITICKYNTYQNIKEKDEQPTNNQRTTNEQQMNSSRTADEHIQEELEEEESKELKAPALPLEQGNHIVLEMVKIFKKHNPLYPIQPTTHYPHCLQIAYRIAEMKGWENHEVGNGKMQEALKSWETILEFVKTDDWLKTRGLIDLNSDKDWDRLVMKMTSKKKDLVEQKEKPSYIKKEKDVDFDKYKRKV